MKVSGILTALAAILAILAALACGGAATPTSPPVLTPAPIPTPTLTSNNAPVPRSSVGNAFNEPLSSGFSVADVVEKALPSVVHIIAGSGSGTGFIVNESGLVVTNKHVVLGSSQVTLRLATGGQFRGNVTRQHPSLDLAYIEIDATQSFTPIAIGDSEEIRVGETVIAIGFPLGRSLGLEPTVSVGIISSKRSETLQTDAAVNPGNSGGPMLTTSGEVIGVVYARVEESQGRPISGIGFAVPINLALMSSPTGTPVPTAGASTPIPTPTATPVPPIPPTIDIQATRQAIEAADALLQTRTAVERENEQAIQAAQEYARSLEATRVANLPTATPVPTPTPQPTPTPLPTPTPHPSIYCEEWEAMVLEWVYQGNVYRYCGQRNPTAPIHPQLTLQEADTFCITDFPIGVLWNHYHIHVGEDGLLPGTYKYYTEDSSPRVLYDHCKLVLNWLESNQTDVRLAYGEPFEIQLLPYHGTVVFFCFNPVESFLYRIGS